MNIFRLSADMLHLLSFVIMLYRMKTQRSCRGVSLKSQILFLVVFCCRYLVSRRLCYTPRAPRGSGCGRWSVLGRWSKPRRVRKYAGPRLWGAGGTFANAGLDPVS
jgi:hypothetical protein